MTDAEIASAAGIIGALDSPLRLQIIALLGERDHFVHEIVNVVGKSQPLVSQHLKVLKESGLVSSTRTGRQVGYHLAVPEVLDVIASVQDLDELATARAEGGSPVGDLDRYRNEARSAAARVRPESLPRADKLAGTVAAAVRAVSHPRPQTPTFGA